MLTNKELTIAAVACFALGFLIVAAMLTLP